MLTDIIDDPVFRSFIFECTFLFGYTSFACYLFGIAFTLSESSRLIYSNWVKSHVVVNILCVATIALPFITNLSCAIAAGIYAVHGDNDMASKLTKAQYGFWTFYCGFLGTLLLFAGIRLMRLLDKHLEVQSDIVNIKKLRTGALKIKIIVVIGSSCMLMFALLIGLYCEYRATIMANIITNMLLAGFWLLAGPNVTFVVIAAVLMNPEFASQLGSLSFGSSSNSRISQERRNDNTADHKDKMESFEMELSSKFKSNQNHFLKNSTQTEQDTRFSFSISKRPEDSMNNLLLAETDSNSISNDDDGCRLSRVEQEQQKYNATTGRVRTPPSPSRTHPNSFS
ncbi:hypothetical protein [Parasitella parasitica]|uniref:Uncharacterized protein n=1 Tax=Parasitella parasitica TaxID=35722 RepID=A0A0B7NRQ8_9FUNG|nr:hypothetical protein [Parasitella parasitica]